MQTSAPIFFILSIAAQVVGFYVGSFLSESSSDLLKIFIPSLTALTITYITKLPRSWLVINSLFPSVLFLLLFTDIPSWVFLAALLFFATLHLPALWTRVPYYPTPKVTYDRILNELPTDKKFTFIDIGCGVGDLLIYLARQRPLGEFIGVEIAPFPYLSSKIKSSFVSNCTVSFQSFWRLDLGNYDFIYAFLSPAPMKLLWEKIRTEKKSSAIFFSNSFEAPSKPDRVLGDEGKGTEVYVYKTLN